MKESIKKKITYRAFVFDDESVIREMIWSLLDARSYEVFTFPHPGLCPQFEMNACPCVLNNPCTDIILSDLNMPVSKGLDFIKAQIKKGCQCKNIAIMSGYWTEDEMSKAKSIGCKIFIKPFKIKVLIQWLDEVEARIEPNRKLSNWWKEDYKKEE
ncbi:MAG: response regulator [Thermodesulfobacteriota bacterium]|nr:response regulator [Thermodesulfobacteriota bacterium]